MKVWDRAGIELATPGSAVRHASVARHVTDCATRPGHFFDMKIKKKMGLKIVRSARNRTHILCMTNHMTTVEITTLLRYRLIL